MFGVVKIVVDFLIIMYGVYNSKLWQMAVALILVVCISNFLYVFCFGERSRHWVGEFVVVVFFELAELCLFFLIISFLEKPLWEYFSNKTLLIEFLISAIVGIWIFIRKDTVFYKLGAFCLILPSLLLDIVGIVLLFFALIAD